MTNIKRLLGLLLVITAGGLYAPKAQAYWFNGFWIYPYKYYYRDTISLRPRTATDTVVALRDIVVANPPLMHKGMNITGTYLGYYNWWVYRSISVTHCEIAGVRRTGPGAHVDFLRIAGAGDSQRVPTVINLTDLAIHDGDGLPIIIQDGMFDSITLKDIRIWNTQIGAQVVANQGHIKSVLVDHCPNLQLLVLGKPGGVDVVYIRNSPGIKVWDNPATPWRKTGAKIVFIN